MRRTLSALGAAAAGLLTFPGRALSRPTVAAPGPGFGNRHVPRPGRPPMNSARECARRRRQAAARGAR